MLEMNFSNITFSGIAIWSHKTCCRRRRCDPRDQLATHPLLRSKLKHSVVVVRWLCVWSSFFLSSGCPSENADGNRCPNCGSPLQSRLAAGDSADIWRWSRDDEMKHRYPNYVSKSFTKSNVIHTLVMFFSRYTTRDRMVFLFTFLRKLFLSRLLQLAR